MHKNNEIKKWCCSGLAKAFEDRNKSTIFVYSEEPDEIVNYSPSFWLAMKSINEKDYDKIKSTHNNTYIITTRKLIHFCPWCGVNLCHMYPSYPNALTDKEIE